MTISLLLFKKRKLWEPHFFLPYRSRTNLPPSRNILYTVFNYSEENMDVKTPLFYAIGSFLFQAIC